MMRWFFHTNYRSFYCLNATQFLGALNDNIFKLLVIYLLINVKGVESASTVLSLAGSIFVIPFLLFSSTAGILADKFSKRTIIVATKFFEFVVMTFGLISVYFESEVGAYTSLFLMATQSSVFGPSKYGIIPEIVEEKMVSKANGSMTSFTYLAIILGTFLASFLTYITDKDFIVIGWVCLLVAVLGLLTSFGICRTEPQRSTKKINPIFLYEIYQTLKVSWKEPYLLTAIFGSSFFLFIGAFTQLNMIPFAMQSLQLDEVGGGFLFLATAVGICIGAVISGQLSKDRVELGLSCISGFFIFLFFMTLFIFSSSLTLTIFSLILLGIFGGGFLIPFDSFIQINSPDEKRGQIIATANFFSFIGVLGAALCIYFFGEELNVSAATGFFFMGIISLLVNVFIVGRLSSFFFPFFVKKILNRFRKLKIGSSLPKPSDLIILQSNSWWDAILLFSCFPHLKILIPSYYFRTFPWINGWMDSIRVVPPDLDSPSNLQRLFKKAKKLQQNHDPVCLFFHKKVPTEEILTSYEQVFGKFHRKLIFAHGIKEKIPKKWMFFRFQERQITLTFDRDR